MFFSNNKQVPSFGVFYVPSLCTVHSVPNTHDLYRLQTLQYSLRSHLSPLMLCETCDINEPLFGMGNWVSESHEETSGIASNIYFQGIPLKYWPVRVTIKLVFRRPCTCYNRQKRDQKYHRNYEMMGISLTVVIAQWRSVVYVLNYTAGIIMCMLQLNENTVIMWYHIMCDTILTNLIFEFI